MCILSPAFPLDEGDYRAGFALDLARALCDRGVRTVIHTPDREGAKADLGLDVRWFPWSGGHKAIARTRLWHPRDVRDLLSLLRNGRRSILEILRTESVRWMLALWALPCGVLARFAWGRTDIGYSVWTLGSDVWRYARLPLFRTVVRQVLRDAAHCFADGVALAAEVQSISGRPCSFLPTSRRLPPPSRAPKRRDDGKVRFLYVGRFDHVKGVDLIPDAVRRLPPRCRAAIQVKIFGEGPLCDEIDRRIASPPLAACITRGDRLTRQEFADELVDADAVLIPSRMESIPVVLTDAMQGNVPVLVADVGDMGELVRRHRAGLVFLPDDAADLAECITRFVADRGRVYETGELARIVSIDRSVDHIIRALGGVDDAS